MQAIADSTELRPCGVGDETTSYVVVWVAALPDDRRQTTGAQGRWLEVSR